MTDRWKVLVACSLPDEAFSILRQMFEVTVLPQSERPDENLVVKAAAGVDAILFSVTLKMHGALVEQLPARVVALATYSVGYDHIDLRACARRNLRVFNTPDVLTDAVAENGMLLLLGAARRAREASNLILSGRWKGWQPTQLNGVELPGKTMGIFGMGRIGRAVAYRARSFGMTIHYSNRNRLDDELEAGAIFHADPLSLLQACDVLVLTCPANEATRGFLNSFRIAHLRRGAIVVNVSRGNVVVDEALIEALTSGHVRAAGLDVFDNEPNIDKRYLRLENAFVLPHIGSSTVETRARMATILCEGLLAARLNRPATNQIVSAG